MVNVWFADKGTVKNCISLNVFFCICILKYTTLASLCTTTTRLQQITKHKFIMLHVESRINPFMSVFASHHQHEYGEYQSMFLMLHVMDRCVCN